MPPTFGTAADAVHPAARRHVALRDRPGAAELREARAVVGERLGEAAVLGESRAIARLVGGLLEQPERPALVVELCRRRDSGDLERDALQRLGDRVGLHGAAGEVDQRSAPSRDEAVAEVARAGPSRRSGCCASRARRRRPRTCRAPSRRRRAARASRSRSLAVIGWPSRVDAEAAPVALAVDLLVRRPSPRRRARTDRARRARRHARRADSRRRRRSEQRVVERDARLAGDGAAQQLLQARARRGRERDRLAVAAEAAREPEHVDDQPLGLAPCPVKSTAASRADGRCRRAVVVAARARPVGERCEVLGSRAVQMQRAVAARDEPGAARAA